MSDNTPQDPSNVPPAPPASDVPPAPPAYDAPPASPSYDAPPAAPYGYPGTESAPPAYAPQPPAAQPYGQNAPGAYPPPTGYPQQPQAAPYAYAGAYPYAAQPKTNGLAITSLVSSIAAFVVLPFIASIVGVITGHIALKQLRTSGENGRGMALAGVIVGWVGVAGGLLFILFIVIAIVAGINAGSSYSTYS